MTLASLARLPCTLVSAVRAKVHFLFFFPTALAITKLVSLVATSLPVAWWSLAFSVALVDGVAVLPVGFPGAVVCAAQQVQANKKNTAVNRTHVFLLIGFALLWLARIIPLNSGSDKRSEAILCHAAHWTCHLSPRNATSHGENAMSTPSARKRYFCFLSAALLLGGYSATAQRLMGATQAVPPAGHGGPLAPILLAPVLIALGAGLGGGGRSRLGPPADSGGALIGVVEADLGYYFHEPVLTLLRDGETVRRILDMPLVLNVGFGRAAQLWLAARGHADRLRQIIT